MTATEVLRRLLDERGVEWTAPNSILRDTMTCWTAGGFYYEAFEVPEPDGTFLLTAAHQDDLTPEQAIAATLGSSNWTDDERTNGTCHDLAVTPAHSHKTEFKCSKCGYEYNAVGIFGVDSGDDPDFNYCPNCGRKVVDE